jgi:hypothetical protein
MFLEFVNEHFHAIIPQLNGAIVQRREHPWTARVESQPFHTVAFALEL